MKHNHDRQSGSNFHAFLPLIPPFPPCRFRSQPILIRDANNIFAFRRGLQHFDDFAISMNHVSNFSNLRSLEARSKRISKFLSDKIFSPLPSPFAIKNDKRKKRNEDGILYAYKYNVVLASHPVHHGCTIVKEYRCNSTNT